MHAKPNHRSWLMRSTMTVYTSVRISELVSCEMLKGKRHELQETLLDAVSDKDPYHFDPDAC